MRIGSMKLWTECVERVAHLPVDQRAQAVAYFREEANAAIKKSPKMATAEGCLYRALAAVHEKYSPMRSGAEEYEMIMKAQAFIEGEGNV